jgi:hypothetical protein
MDKLFTTIHTIFVSFTSAYGMFLFFTLFNGDFFIEHLAAVRAKVHPSVFALVIKVGTIHFLWHHSSLLAIYGYKFSNSPIIFIYSSFSHNDIMMTPNPPPNWKHGNAAACGKAFVCPDTASATHKEPFSPR